MQSNCILVDDDVQRRRESVATRTLHRLNHRRNCAQLFYADRNLHQTDDNETRVTVSSNLRKWILEKCWTMCLLCQSLLMVPMYEKMSEYRGRVTQTCICTTGTYTIPRWCDWPDCLKQLTSNDQNTLAVYSLRVGSRSPKQHGYKFKDDSVYAVISPMSVADKISAVEDLERRGRIQTAYRFLLSTPESDYKSFIDRFDSGILPSKLSSWSLFTEKSIETAIWPLLYPLRKYCESNVVDDGHKQSVKKSYTLKLLSNVADYSGSFEILRFVYDLSIYKTISGAISAAKSFRCSPARALDGKSFSPTFWEWQYCQLVDAVKQFGYPNIFLTISPYEWQFPTPEILRERFNLLGRGPTELATLETLHIAHTLEQIVRGYVSGRGKKPWKTNLLMNTVTKRCNVKTYFYRFEFQNRGTVHLHYIAWLEDTSKLDVSRFHSDLPAGDIDYAHSVYNNQKSRKPCPGVTVNSAPSRILTLDGQSIFQLTRSEAAQSVNLRVYADTLLTALDCSMDIQLTDGRNLLLKYVAGYVTKFRDHSVPRDMLFHSMTGHHVASRYLRYLSPAEPEMVMYLAGIKVAHTPSETKKILVPTQQTVCDNKIIQAYVTRPRYHDNLNLYDYIHKYTFSDGLGHLRRCRTEVLVGLKCVSLLNDEYFFQDALLHKPFRNYLDLRHPNFDTLPSDLKNFSYAMTNRYTYWLDDVKLKKMCSDRGDRDYFIRTFIHYVRSFFHTWNAFTSHLLTHDQLDIIATSFFTGNTLSPTQAAFVNIVVEDVTEKTMADDRDLPVQVPTFHLLRGRQGTGKTLCLIEIIRQCIVLNAEILVLTPTGLLASHYKAIFGKHISTDTVHGGFKISVSSEPTTSVNWRLRHYHLILLDEVSMVSLYHSEHITNSLVNAATNSVVILCGDSHQLQPVPVHGVTGSLFQCNTLMSKCKSTTFTTQFRTQDDTLQNFLSICRYRRPTHREISTFCDGIVLCQDSHVTEHNIFDFYSARPGAQILTFTNSACNQFNEVICARKFSGKDPLLRARFPTSRSKTKPIYEGMSILITENRNKVRNFVNGQLGTVSMALGNTVMVKIQHNKIIRIYPITDDFGTYYPFTLAYAKTIHKAQGQTYDSVTLYFDSRFLPSGCAYVALSRARRRQDIAFVCMPNGNHFFPFVA